MSLFRCFFFFFFLFFCSDNCQEQVSSSFKKKQKESMGLGLATKLKGITVISSLTFVHFGVR